MTYILHTKQDLRTEEENSSFQISYNLFYRFTCWSSGTLRTSTSATLLRVPRASEFTSRILSVVKSAPILID